MMKLLLSTLLFFATCFDRGHLHFVARLLTDLAHDVDVSLQG